jgi:aminomethyltransferase
MSAAEQHLATRRSAGLFDFSFMGLREFTSARELQRLQTRDLATLAIGQAAYTLLLKGDGAVLIDATVWRLDAERYWLFTGKRAAHGGRDRSGEYAILALQGPASGKVLARITGEPFVRDLRYFRFAEAKGLLVARLGFSGELGYELLVPAAREGALRDELKDVPACSFEAADTLRIESGYVLFDREVDGRANPSELGLERFAGKRFPIKRKLVGLEPAAGGEAKGRARITSECDSPTLGRRIALGFAPPEVRVGDSVALGDGRTARVARLPFYDPERRRPRDNPL